MRGRAVRSTGVVTVLVATAAPLLLAIGGCERSSPDPQAAPASRPAAGAPARAPAATEPSLAEKLAALSPYAMPATAAAAAASSTAPATTATTTPTTAPAAPAARTREFATPDAAMAFMLASAKDAQWRELRQVSLEPLDSDELEQRMARIAAWTRRGSVNPVEVRTNKSIAVAVLVAEASATAKKTYFPLVLAERYGSWKIGITEKINPRHFTEQERRDLPPLAQWGTARVKELNGASPATTASPTGATGR